MSVIIIHPSHPKSPSKAKDEVANLGGDKSRSSGIGPEPERGLTEISWKADYFNEQLPPDQSDRLTPGWPQADTTLAPGWCNLAPG